MFLALSICINESALLVLISPCLGLLMGNAYDEIGSQYNNKVMEDFFVLCCVKPGFQ